MVNPCVRAVNGWNVKPVSFKSVVLKELPNNYDITFKRKLLMRRTSVKILQLKETLTDMFAELLKDDWILRANKNENDFHKKLYLPFFVTKTAKPRVAHDGAAMTT